MDIFINFFTVLAVFVVLKNVSIFAYTRIIKNSKIKDRRQDYLITRSFGSYDRFRYFWISVLWLLVFYYSVYIVLFETLFAHLKSISIVI